MYCKRLMSVLPLLCLSAFGQDAPSPPPPPAAPSNAVWIGAEGAHSASYTLRASLSGPDIRFEGEPVSGAPYSADAVIETVQTLSDGNQIRRESSSVVYRDAEGRTRREDTIQALGPWATQEKHKMIFINDPVSGVHYILNPVDRTGRRLPSPRVEDHIDLPQGMRGKLAGQRQVAFLQRGDVSVAGGPQTTAATRAIRMAPPAEIRNEDLGKRLIEGVEALGSKMTTVIPAEQVGAERDIEITFERWHSPELAVDLLTIRKDPRMGETTYKLVNLNRTAPLPSLFEPPADYDIAEPTSDNDFLYQDLPATGEN